jgi:hypothetical protein
MNNRRDRKNWIEAAAARLTRQRSGFSADAAILAVRAPSGRRRKLSQESRFIDFPAADTVSLTQF